MKPESVDNPSICPMVVDGIWIWGEERFAPPGHPEVGPWADETFTWWLNAPAARHPSERTNMVFVDGHVDAYLAGYQHLPQPGSSYLLVTAWQGIDFQPRSEHSVRGP